jgi:hypothetical protein
MEFTTNYTHGDVLFFLDGFSVRKGTVTTVTITSIAIDGDTENISTTINYTLSTALGLQVREESLLSKNITDFIGNM